MKRYMINNSARILIVILTAVCFLGYIICSYYINIHSLQTINNNIHILDNMSTIETIRDILLVIISICGTNLLLSALVEVKSKNAFLTDIIENDVISAPEFYETMKDENKVKIHNALEEVLYFSYPVVHNMFSNIRSKLNSDINSYYFESCSYVVSCSVKDNYIEKEITKKADIKPYDDTFTINDFSVGNFFSREIDGIKPFDLTSLEIDGRKIDLKQDVSEKPNVINNLDEQNEYNLSISYIYNKPLEISKSTATKIVVKCKTRTPIDDKVSTFRVTKPCKKFSLIYDIKEHDKYRLAVDAFGFLDDADDSTNNSSNSNININFNDWIFKHDGVVVSILDKK